MIKHIYENMAFKKLWGLALLPRKAWKPACSSLIYSPKADIPAFLNMPNTPKAEI